MYNGIGLATVRGSGTNGYVQRNMAHVSRQRTAQQKSMDKRPDVSGSAMVKDPRRANTDIIDHNRKRQVEVKVLALQEELEAKGMPEEEIEERTEQLRTTLLAKLPPTSTTHTGVGARPGETHADAAAKEAETAALKDALGIKADYKSGTAFDQELQARLKEERMAKRQAEADAKAAAEAELERERAREEKRRQKEARREEKEARRAEKRQRREEARGDAAEGGSS